ncbi:hypothetical protein GALMADRAFT_1050707 [Galerina marginata CBS 339.88]|uniref:Uncharacterized protein n=1 Tax=Galerina marginata (strain CBS 339.88) TaxID=685588 RepID=A0A067SDI3_GALM3|nr:hypothetical protein GALMADRAFT_1050707 [Galerina marginata CBS 339.88]
MTTTTGKAYWLRNSENYGFSLFFVLQSWSYSTPGFLGLGVTVGVGDLCHPRRLHYACPCHLDRWMTLNDSGVPSNSMSFCSVLFDSVLSILQDPKLSFRFLSAPPNRTLVDIHIPWGSALC